MKLWQTVQAHNKSKNLCSSAGSLLHSLAQKPETLAQCLPHLWHTDNILVTVMECQQPGTELSPKLLSQATKESGIAKKFWSKPAEYTLTY